VDRRLALIHPGGDLRQPGGTLGEDAEQAQPPLIPMSREELDEAAQDLAGQIAELEEMEADHAAQRKTMRDTRNALLGTIGAVASTIRSHGR